MSPLQLLGIVQQGLQVREAKGSVETITVGPRLPDVRVFPVQVLKENAGQSANSIPDPRCTPQIHRTPQQYPQQTVARCVTLLPRILRDYGF